MLYYRLYVLERDGHVVSAIVFESEDDAAAIAFAEAQGEPRAMELWNEARRVKAFEARGAGSHANTPWSHQLRSPEGAHSPSPRRNTQNRSPPSVSS